MNMVSVEYNGFAIGQNIRNAREEQKMTLMQLSEAVGKSTNHINHIELGTRKLTMGLMYEFMGVLDMDANTILGISPKSPTIDDELKKLPKKQREYFESVFRNMILAYSNVA